MTRAEYVDNPAQSVEPGSDIKAAGGNHEDLEEPIIGRKRKGKGVKESLSIYDLGLPFDIAQDIFRDRFLPTIFESLGESKDPWPLVTDNVITKEIPVRYGSLSGHKVSYAHVLQSLEGVPPAIPERSDLDLDDPSTDLDEDEQSWDWSLGLEEGD